MAEDLVDPIVKNTDVENPNKLTFKVGIGEVKALVQPEGACRDLGDIRVNESPLSEEFYDPLDARWEKLISETQPKVDSIRGYFKDMMNNDSVLLYINNLETGQEWNRDEIQKTLGLYEGYNFTLDRLHLILNKNIDPELVHLSMERYIRKRNLPGEVVDVLNSDTRLLTRFVKLILDPKFEEEFRRSSKPSSTPYTQEMENKITSLVEYWTQLVGERSGLDEITDRTKSGLEDFFNINGDLYLQQEEAGGHTLLQIRDLTSQVYFEKRIHNSIGEDVGWSHFSFNTPTLEYLLKYAQTVEKGRYLTEIYNKTSSLYQEYFPEVYTDPDVKGLIITDPFRPWSDTEPEDVCTEANGVWRGEKHHIVINSGNVIRSKTAQDISENNGFHLSGNIVKRKITDTVTMAHELTHGIYEKLVRKKVDMSKVEHYHSTADHAINEGFAVLMELLMADKLISNAKDLDFNEKDIRQFQECKRGRLSRLIKEKNGYTEGSYQILHRVFVEGAGRGNERDVHKGLLAVREFLDTLDVQKTINIKRDSPEYKQALKEGSPQKFTGLFSTPQNEVV